MKLFIKKAGAIITAFAIAGLSGTYSIAVKAESSDDIKNKIDNSNSEMSDLKNQLDTLTSQINDMDAKATQLVYDMFETQQKLEQKEEEQQARYNDMKYRIKYLYENNETNVMQTFLSSDSITDMLNSAEYYQNIYSYDRGQLERLKAEYEEIDGLNKQYASELSQVSQAQTEMSNKQDELANLVASKEAEISQLDAELASKLKEEEAVRKAQAAAAEEAKRKAAEEASRATSQKPSGSRPSNGNGVNNGSSSSGGASSDARPSVPDKNYTSMGAKIADYARRGLSNFPCTAGWCAAWVSGVYAKAGATPPRGNAIDYWLNWSSSGGTGYDVPLGACVISSGFGAAGATYGHIGIYIGNGQVASNVGYLKIQSIESFGTDATATCRGYKGYIGWVWPNGKALN